MQRTSGRKASIGATQPRRPSGRRSPVVSYRPAPVVLPLAEPFRALTPDERVYLQCWWKQASSAGIETIEDLMTRPWPRPVAETIIGVFRTGEDLATWMVIGQDGAWVVASCSDGTVSGASDTLAAALARIHPVDDSF
ncbi:MAG TPA: hypothetical protein VL614_18270 [Acetobacteraceae bacterium]|jgi:hypothetical protein|nr:hypothetical protein [Acetobacteraceae bacterium]